MRSQLLKKGLFARLVSLVMLVSFVFSSYPAVAYNAPSESYNLRVSATKHSSRLESLATKLSQGQSSNFAMNAGTQKLITALMVARDRAYLKAVNSPGTADLISKGENEFAPGHDAFQAVKEAKGHSLIAVNIVSANQIDGHLLAAEELNAALIAEVARSQLGYALNEAQAVAYIREAVRRTGATIPIVIHGDHIQYTESLFAQKKILAEEYEKVHGKKTFSEDIDIDSIDLSILSAVQERLKENAESERKVITDICGRLIKAGFTSIAIDASTIFDEAAIDVVLDYYSNQGTPEEKLVVRLEKEFALPLEWGTKFLKLNPKASDAMARLHEIKETIASDMIKRERSEEEIGEKLEEIDSAFGVLSKEARKAGLDTASVLSAYDRVMEDTAQVSIGSWEGKRLGNILQTVSEKKKLLFLPTSNIEETAYQFSEIDSLLKEHKPKLVGRFGLEAEVGHVDRKAPNPRLGGKMEAKMTHPMAVRVMGLYLRSQNLFADLIATNNGSGHGTEFDLETLTPISQIGKISPYLTEELDEEAEVFGMKIAQHGSTGSTPVELSRLAKVGVTKFNIATIYQQILLNALSLLDDGIGVDALIARIDSDEEALINGLHPDTREKLKRMAEEIKNDPSKAEITEDDSLFKEFVKRTYAWGVKKGKIKDSSTAKDIAKVFAKEFKRVLGEMDPKLSELVGAQALVDNKVKNLLANGNFVKLFGDDRNKVEYLARTILSANIPITAESIEQLLETEGEALGLKPGQIKELAATIPLSMIGGGIPSSSSTETVPVGIEEHEIIGLQGYSRVLLEEDFLGNKHYDLFKEGIKFATAIQNTEEQTLEVRPNFKSYNPMLGLNNAESAFFNLNTMLYARNLVSETGEPVILIGEQLRELKASYGKTMAAKQMKNSPYVWEARSGFAGLVEIRRWYGEKQFFQLEIKPLDAIGNAGSTLFTFLEKDKKDGIGKDVSIIVRPKRTVMIVGYGTIGNQVAMAQRKLGFNVVAANRSPGDRAMNAQRRGVPLYLLDPTKAKDFKKTGIGFEGTILEALDSGEVDGVVDCTDGKVKHPVSGDEISVATLNQLTIYKKYPLLKEFYQGAEDPKIADTYFATSIYRALRQWPKLVAKAKSMFFPSCNTTAQGLVIDPIAMAARAGTLAVRVTSHRRALDPGTGKKKGLIPDGVEIVSGYHHAEDLLVGREDTPIIEAFRTNEEGELKLTTDATSTHTTKFHLAEVWIEGVLDSTGKPITAEDVIALLKDDPRLAIVRFPGYKFNSSTLLGILQNNMEIIQPYTSIVQVQNLPGGDVKIIIAIPQESDVIPNNANGIEEALEGGFGFDVAYNLVNDVMGLNEIKAGIEARLPEPLTLAATRIAKRPTESIDLKEIFAYREPSIKIFAENTIVGDKKQVGRPIRVDKLIESGFDGSLLAHSATREAYINRIVRSAVVDKLNEETTSTEFHLLSRIAKELVKQINGLHKTSSEISKENLDFNALAKAVDDGESNLEIQLGKEHFLMNTPLINEIDYIMIKAEEKARGEFEGMINTRTISLLANNKPILNCVGGSIEQIQEQLRIQFLSIAEEEIRDVDIAIANEPPDLIGKIEDAGGEDVSAETDNIRETHQIIYEFFEEKYGTEIANSVKIMYGASVDGNNVDRIMSVRSVRPDMKDYPLVHGTLFATSGATLEGYLAVAEGVNRAANRDGANYISAVNLKQFLNDSKTPFKDYLKGVYAAISEGRINPSKTNLIISDQDTDITDWKNILEEVDKNYLTDLVRQWGASLAPVVDVVRDTAGNFSDVIKELVTREDGRIYTIVINHETLLSNGPDGVMAMENILKQLGESGNVKFVLHVARDDIGQEYLNYIIDADFKIINEKINNGFTALDRSMFAAIVTGTDPESVSGQVKEILGEPIYEVIGNQQYVDQFKSDVPVKIVLDAADKGKVSLASKALKLGLELIPKNGVATEEELKQLDSLFSIDGSGNFHVGSANIVESVMTSVNEYAREVEAQIAI